MDGRFKRGGVIIVMSTAGIDLRRQSILEKVVQIPMNFKALCAFLLVACTSLCLPAHAQEVVHALSGTVNAIDAKAKTITVITDDGSEGFFKDLGKAKPSLEFDKRVRAETVAPDTFDKKGDRIILFYVGFGEDRTAIALRDLGPGPFEEATGTVVKMDKGAHLVTIKTAAGAAESFRVDPGTIAESDGGPVQGEKFDVREGEHVRVIASPGTGNKAALFIIQLSL
jgi:Cu/Ag efflux protein CusF